MNKKILIAGAMLAINIAVILTVCNFELILLDSYFDQKTAIFTVHISFLYTFLTLLFYIFYLYFLLKEIWKKPLLKVEGGRYTMRSYAHHLQYGIQVDLAITVKKRVKITDISIKHDQLPEAKILYTYTSDNQDILHKNWVDLHGLDEKKLDKLETPILVKKSRRLNITLIADLNTNQNNIHDIGGDFPLTEWKIVIKTNRHKTIEQKFVFHQTTTVNASLNRTGDIEFPVGA